MTDFLLELRSEEIPARMQAGARADLERLFREQMTYWGATFGDLKVWSTPRRLVLIASDLPTMTAPVSEEVKGPRVSAPPQALDGFLRKTKLTQEQLVERDGVYYAVKDLPGFDTKEVLKSTIFAVVLNFPWPKSQRWGPRSRKMTSLRWVRPLSGIVALFGDQIVGEGLEANLDGIRPGRTTLGHRFHHSGEITIGSAADYCEKLRACHVIVDHAEREGLIREMSRAAALAAGLELVEDEGLVIENAGLTEWPVPLLGRFDAAFLEVPPEVIQLTARTNQKYFVCTSPLPLAGGGDGRHVTPVTGGPVIESADNTPSPNPSRKREGDLANAFVCTANIAAHDGGAAIVDGNRKVLAARLSDARFFWEQDRKKTLAQHAEKLSNIVFHEKLGTVADKVDRVAKLARWLVEEGIVKSSPERGGGSPSSGLTEGAHLSVGAAPDGEVGPLRHAFGAPPPRAGEDLATLAEQAARLCKADLVTEMVGEFPELQGLMGGYYARAEGLDPQVADAIRDHYKPVGQGDEVPTAPVTVAVSLADKLDTLVGFFFYHEAPTGSKDPFALRRAAIAVVGLVSSQAIKLPIMSTCDFCIGLLSDTWKKNLKGGGAFGHAMRNDPKLGQHDQQSFDLLAFFADRLKVQQREAGVRHDLIDAVFALGGEDDLVRLLARVHALQAFVGTGDGANLLAGYKRAANILKKEGFTAPLPVGEGPGVGVPTSASAEHPHPTLPLQGEGYGYIPRDGEEDPFAMVDDPDMAEIFAERARMKNALSYTPEPAEKALIDALDAAAPTASTAVAEERFADAMAALATLRVPIDVFFEEVTVNDPDPAKRAARLALLGRFRDAVHAVADFSRIEG